MRGRGKAMNVRPVVVVVVVVACQNEEGPKLLILLLLSLKLSYRYRQMCFFGVDLGEPEAGERQEARLRRYFDIFHI